MEKPQDQDVARRHNGLRWLRKILFTFWICRILLLVLMGVAQVASVYWISQEVNMKGAVLASLIVTVLFAVLCISSDAVSMLLLGRDALEPRAFLVMQGVETTLWTGVIVVQITAAISTSTKSRSFLTWLISGVL